MVGPPVSLTKFTRATVREWAIDRTAAVIPRTLHLYVELRRTRVAGERGKPTSQPASVLGSGLETVGKEPTARSEDGVRA